MRLPSLRKTLAATAAASALLMTAACGSDEEPSTSTDTSTSAAPSDDASDAADDATSDSTGAYAAGTYEGSGSYSNPGGTSSVSVSITLADGGEITDVEVTPEASGTSLQYQEKFAGGIADEIVGKSIDDIDVSKVSGSSLTSGGFNEAVDQIKSEAQA